MNLVSGDRGWGWLGLTGEKDIKKKGLLRHSAYEISPPPLQTCLIAFSPHPLSSEVQGCVKTSRGARGKSVHE